MAVSKVCLRRCFASPRPQCVAPASTSKIILSKPISVLDDREQRPAPFVRNRPARIGCNLTRSRAPIGERHRAGCDIERCPHCGWSALGCAHFHADDPRREVWNGKWPGEDDCERLNFFVNGDADFPDLNRLFTDCVWDADAQRWERRQ
jgi:hypothetical protein